MIMIGTVTVDRAPRPRRHHRAIRVGPSWQVRWRAYTGGPSEAALGPGLVTTSAARRARSHAARAACASAPTARRGAALRSHWHAAGADVGAARHGRRGRTRTRTASGGAALPDSLRVRPGRRCRLCRKRQVRRPAAPVGPGSSGPDFCRVWSARVAGLSHTAGAANGPVTGPARPRRLTPTATVGPAALLRMGYHVAGRPRPGRGTARAGRRHRRRGRDSHWRLGGAQPGRDDSDHVIIRRNGTGRATGPVPGPGATVTYSLEE